MVQGSIQEEQEEVDYQERTMLKETSLDIRSCWPEQIC